MPASAPAPLRRIAVALAALAFGPTTAAAAPRDTTMATAPVAIANGTQGSNPTKVVDATGTGYFAAEVTPTTPFCTGRYCGYEETRRDLFRTDGTAEGTRLVATLPTPIDVPSLTAAGSRVYFGLTDPSGQGGPSGLWTSDGTTAGTARAWPVAGQPARGATLIGASGERVLFFAVTTHPGSSSIDPDYDATLLALGPGSEATQLWSGVITWSQHWQTLRPATATADGSVYLLLPGAGGQALWRTDGTPAGTRPTGIAGAGRPVGVHGNTLYFVNDGRILRTDGTAAGTLPPPADYPEAAKVTNDYTALAATADRAFFLDTDEHQPTRVWATDGTHVTQVSSGTAYRSGIGPAQLVATSAYALFVAEDRQGIRQLWSSDGASPAAQLTQLDGAERRRISELSVAGGRGYFNVGDRIWTTDGTPAGTHAISDDAQVFPFVKISNLSTAGGRTFFTGEDQEAGNELWTTDGTPAGTHVVADLLTRPLGYYGGFDSHSAVLGGAAILTRRGPSLWRTDGTAVGTRRLAYLPQALDGPMRRSGPYLYLRLHSWTDGGQQLWRTDGTAAGTIPLTGADGLDVVEDLTPRAGGGLVFTGPSARGRGTAVWTTDGTPASTRRIAELPTTRPARRSTLGTDGEKYTAAGRFVFFQVAGRRGDWQLMRTDGTAAGTRPVPGVRGRVLARAAAHGRLWFARTPDDGGQLWSTDGRAGGTRRETRLAARGGAGAVHAITTTPQGRVVFSARAGDDERLSAVTRSGPRAAVLTTLPAPAIELGVAGGRLSFATKPVWRHGGMWATDGTRAGTRLLREFSGEGPTCSVTVARVRYCESEGDLSEGDFPMLWRTDGTARGTRRVRVTVAGAPANYTGGLVTDGRSLLFGAYRTDAGYQLVAKAR